MAIMYPDKVDWFSVKQEGEKLTYDFLKDILPDNYNVFYNIRVNGSYPDFIVVSPEIGIIVLEVKDWSLDFISSSNVEFFELINSPSDKNPLKKAEEFRNIIEELLKTEDNLLQIEGRYRGNLKFPRCAGVVFPNIERSEFINSIHRNSIDEKLILFKDDIECITSTKGTTLLIDKLKNMFINRRSFSFEALSTDDMDIITKHLYKDSSFYIEENDSIDHSKDYSKNTRSKKKGIFRKIIILMLIYLLATPYFLIFAKDFSLYKYITNFLTNNFDTSYKNIEGQPDNTVLPKMILRVGHNPQGKGTFIVIRDDKRYLTSKTFTEGSYIEFYDSKKVIIYDSKSDKTEFNIEGDVINLEVGNAYTKIYLDDKEQKHTKYFKYDFLDSEIIK